MGRGTSYGVCNNTTKGRGGASENLGLLKHEVGHQFGGGHTYHVNNTNELTTTAGAQGVIGLNANFFHSTTIEHVAQFIHNGTGSNCPQLTPTGNTPPQMTVSAVNGSYIPINTPFILQNTLTTDPDATDEITYVWQNIDGGTPENPDTTAINKLLFTRDLPSAVGHTRTVPHMQNILNGTNDPYSVLSTIPRDINLHFIARDNSSPAGGVNLTFETIHVANNNGAFVVTAPTQITPGVAREPITVSWEVADTHLSPFNASTVAIILSKDGGQTWSDTLLHNTPNYGTEDVILPTGSETTAARIMVRPLDQIFFNINPSAFEILPAGSSGYEIRKTAKVFQSCTNDVTVDLNVIKIGDCCQCDRIFIQAPHSW